LAPFSPSFAAAHSKTARPYSVGKNGWMDGWLGATHIFSTGKHSRRGKMEKVGEEILREFTALFIPAKYYWVLGHKFANIFYY
jgi:hypothetical protein